MYRSQGFAASTPPKVRFSEIPPDVVQAVQIVPAQSRALTNGAPPSDKRVFFSDMPPDVVQAVQVVATPQALSMAPWSQLSETITQLRANGVSDDEIRQFLKQIGTSYTFALGEAQNGVTVMLPGGNLLTPAQSELLLAAIAAEMSVVSPALALVLMPLLRLLPTVANRFNVTIGIGPALSGGVVAGTSFGVGILFAPGNRIGFYGSLGAVLGAIISINGTMQVTIVKGGPEVFGGSAVAVTVGGGEGIVGSASALLSQGQFIGLSFTMGVGAGITPIETYAQFQYTPTSLGLACVTV